MNQVLVLLNPKSKQRYECESISFYIWVTMLLGVTTQVVKLKGFKSNELIILLTR